MSTLLHISASPLADHSFSRRIAEAFVASWREANPGGVVDTLNVWTEPLPAFDALSASWKLKTMGGIAPSAEELAVAEHIKRVTDRFQAADKYIISCPMWNFTVPYPLKHYIDVLVQPGLTFGFDPSKGYFGLVPSHRPVQLVLARGGAMAATPGLDFQQPYLTTVPGLMWLSDVRSIVIDCTAYGPAVSDPLLVAALDTAKRDGASF